MVHVTYGKESSSCLLNSMYWFPADPFSFLPSLSGELTQIGQDGNQLQSGNQPDQVKKPDGETEIINPSGPQSCITCLTWAVTFIAQCRLCNSSLPTNPRKLRWSHTVDSITISQVMTGTAKITVDGSRPLCQGCSRESGAGSWHRKDTAPCLGPTVPRALPEARQQFTCSRASRG